MGTLFNTEFMMAFVGRFGNRMLAQLAGRSISTTARKQEVHPVYKKFKEQQKPFQVNNGLYIHERGKYDKAMEIFTGVWSIAGLVTALYLTKRMAFNQWPVQD